MGFSEKSWTNATCSLLIGLLILIPRALYLSFEANAAAFDTTYYAVQAVDLLASAANISLLGLNIRVG